MGTVIMAMNSHVLGDAVGSIGVIVSSLIIMFASGSWRYYMDPVISLLISGLIISSAAPLVRSASFVLLQGVPTSISVARLREQILSIDGVFGVHELHVWGLSDTRNGASVHVRVAEGASARQYMEVAAAIKRLMHGCGVHSTTVQPEFFDTAQRMHRVGEDDAIAEDIAESNGCLLKCEGDGCNEQRCCPEEVETVSHEARSPNSQVNADNVRPVEMEMLGIANDSAAFLLSGSKKAVPINDDQRVHRWNGDGEYVGSATCGIFDTSSQAQSGGSARQSAGGSGAATISPVFVTDMQWFPNTQAKGSQSGAAEMYAAGGTDGKFYLCSKAGRVEKIVEAHKGAVLALKWNYEGSALVSAGEDGNLKIWSKTGMLRSGLVQNGYPIYAVSWSPDNDSILYTNGRNLVIKPIQPSNKPVMVSGEDCRYRVWDSFGRMIYLSMPHDHPITSLAWNPAGEMFAVGLFNTLRVCDKLGWSNAVEKPECGSIFSIAWTPDGTQIACGGGNGAVVFGHIIGRRLEWKNYEVTLLDDRRVRVYEVINGSVENL
ncbi:Intraflagellar transport protein 80, partial [Entophlyctis luteolus]